MATIDLSTLDLAEIKDIAHASGYGTDDWILVAFHSAPGGSVIYTLTYQGSSGSETGLIYLQIVKGRLTLEF